MQGTNRPLPYSVLRQLVLGTLDKAEWTRPSMELSFASEKLRSICESRRRATNRLGADTAKSLEMVLADIEACQTVSEFEALYGDHVAPSKNDCWQVNLDGAATMTFASGHVSTPRKKDGRIDWQRVTRVKIEAIGAKP